MLPPLAKAELAVMNLLWQANSMTARQLREQLYPDADRSQHGTVQRLLQRLEDKGYIKRDRSLPVHLFSAAISKQAYGGEQIEQIANDLTAGSIAPLLTHLVEHKKISNEEIDRLRAILRDSESQSGDAE